LWYEDVLPLSWRVRQEETGESERLRERNERVVQALEALEEPRREDREEDAREARLQRFELKLDLVLELLGQLVLGHISIPERLPLHLSTRALVWESDHPPPEGAAVQVDLYLSPRYPQPIGLAGVVQAVEPAPSGVSRVTVIFGDLGEVVQDWLERSLFRHHRRRVARARHPVF
jgi:hypothetical protein